MPTRSLKRTLWHSARRGLGDESYVGALNTISIQVSLDRLANALGVQPDERPIFPA